MAQEPPDGRWTLLTGHGHVLVAVARNPQARVRELAHEARLTERTTQAILADLEAAGYVTRTRVGRRTSYTVHLDRSFRHHAQNGHQVGPFLALLASPPAAEFGPRVKPEPEAGPEGRSKGGGG